MTSTTTHDPHLITLAEATYADLIAARDRRRLDLRLHMPACAPRCTDHEAGHLRSTADNCYSESERLTLSLGAPIEADEDEDPTDFVETYLWKSSDEGVTVNVSHHEETCLVMTVDEARQLAERLLALVTLAG